jgi:signal transduction histidine kinase
MVAAHRANDPFNTRQVFRLLVAYRWLSLIPPALVLLTGWGNGAPWLLGITLLAAASVNLLLTSLSIQFNTWLRRWPGLLMIDLLFTSSLVALTGGWNSPYYLYTFSPLLGAALFFQLRGALLAVAGMAGLFVLAGLSQTGATFNWLQLAEQLAAYLILGGAVGYATTLLARYTNSLTDLDRAHSDLAVIHELTVSLQSAADVVEVEERVLEVVTRELGFPRAVIALVDQREHVLTAWLGMARNGHPMLAGGLPHPLRLPITSNDGAIAQSLLDGQARLSVESHLTANEQMNDYLGRGPYHLFPLQLREHSVGVLLVDASEDDDPTRRHSLRAIAGQAAVAVGTTMLCIDRAQRLAVQDERIRIARELHDTASQSLFGIVFALDGLAKLLPGQPETVKAELAQVRDLAETTRAQMRQSIMDMWPSALTAETFELDLRRFVTQMCRRDELQVDIRVRGSFSDLSPLRRRSLYRVAQEALTNVVKHAAAERVEVVLDVNEPLASLTIQDDGRGFDPAVVATRAHDRERFGLRGITERVTSLGGACEVVSTPGAGTTLRVSLPLTDAG